MPSENLKQLIAQGLQAAKAGGKIAEQATSEIQKDASDPKLKEALQTGNERSQEWMRRIESAISEAGSAEDVGNPVLEAHYEVSQKIRSKAPDPTTCDLGIIAAGQLALHYWIASFGTLRTYASALQIEETADAMQKSLDEAKEADLQHTRLAEGLLSSRELTTAGSKQ